jgi:hypothetical protein
MEIRQIQPTPEALAYEAELDRLIVEKILQFGSLDKVAKSLKLTKTQLKQRLDDPNKNHLKSTVIVEIEKLLVFEGIPASIRYLLDVVRGDVPGNKDRIAAAKTLLDRVGLSAKKARETNDGDKAMADMTTAELQDFIAKREAQMPDVTPDSEPPNAQAPDWLG